MSDVAFHFNVADRLGYACRLLRKAQRLGTAVSVTGAASLLDRLDELLWTFEPTEFVPHLRVAASVAPAGHLQPTPLWLVDDIAQAPPDHRVLLQLADEVPDGVDRFERVIEIVSTDPDEAAAGRLRWRAHAQAGRRIVRHDASVASESG